MVRKTYGLICLLFVIFSFIANAQVAVTTGGPPTNYATLTAAFSAINNGTHTGAITITLTANHTLTASAILNASGTGSANYSSINISPNTNVIISCNFNTYALQLNGADNVTINGVNSSGISLTIRNTHTSNGYGNVLLFTNGASNNVIKNCSLLASCFNTGVIIFSSSTSDNDNDSIYNCNIGTASSTHRPYICVYAPTYSLFGGHASDNVVLYNNNMFDFGMNASSYCIVIGTNQNNWKIYNNRIYQTATLDYSATVIHHIVYYDNNVSAVDIRNNTIGGSNSSNTGSYTLTTTSSGQPSFRGIYIVNASLTTASNIQGNTIKNIVLSTYSNSTLFIGIYVGSGYVDVGNISGNTIGSSTTTGSISIDSKYNSGSVSFYGIYSPSSYVVNISNNTIGSVNFGYSGSGANTMYFYSIIYYFAGGSTTFSNNIIGSAVTSNSIRIGPSSGTGTGNYYFFGIYNYMSAANSSIVQYNTISNIFINCSGSSSYAYGLYNYAGVTATYSIDNNNISNITTASSLTASPSIYGIYLYTTGSGCTISRNTISGLYNTNSSASTRVVGIYHYYSTGYNDIKENIIKSIGCFSNSNDASAWAIYLNNGYTRVINNFIHLNDNYSSNITGIEIFSGAGHSIYYNTILIEGTHSYTGTSSCLKRNNIPTIAQNNIFFNKRTSSGANYSFTNNTSVFTNTTINYNLHVVNNVTSAIYHNGAGRSWTVYSAANTNDRFSWCENSTNLAATSLFTNTSTSNLTINSSNSACWYVNGKGWPVSGIQYDWEGNIGDERSQAVNGGGTDIGADEFNTSTTPPAATASAAPAAGTTTTYTFAGKTIASIAWTGGSNVPASVSVWYYSGNNPPVPIPGKNAFNCYWRIEPSTTPSGMSYRPTLYFSDALLGAVPSTTDLRMAKNSGLTPNINNWSCACSGTTVNATTRTFVPTTPYTSFSIFTGTDINAPLPVELLSFTATKQDKDILLQWQTASEKNTERFDIERSYNGKDFEYTGKTVSAADMSNTLRSYNAIDEEYARTAAIVYYRLKIVDYDGFFEYSNIAVVTNNTVKQTSAVIHPNPFGNSTKLTLQNATSGSIEITIIDLAGNQLYAQIHDLKNPEEEIKIDTEFLKSGTYVLRIVSAQESITTKLIRY
jgi:hypothetical protein